MRALRFSEQNDAPSRNHEPVARWCTHSTPGMALFTTQVASACANISEASRSRRSLLLRPPVQRRVQFDGMQVFSSLFWVTLGPQPEIKVLFRSAAYILFSTNMMKVRKTYGLPIGTAGLGTQHVCQQIR